MLRGRSCRLGRPRFPRPFMLKPAFATLAEGALKIAAVLTLDTFNKTVAALVGILSVVHLIIKIRQDTRKK